MHCSNSLRSVTTLLLVLAAAGVHAAPISPGELGGFDVPAVAGGLLGQLPNVPSTPLTRRGSEGEHSGDGHLSGNLRPGHPNQPSTNHFIPIVSRQEPDPNARAGEHVTPKLPHQDIPVAAPIMRRQKDDSSGDTNIGAPDPRVPGNRNDAPVTVPVLRRQESSQGAPPRKDDGSGDTNIGATYPGAPRKSGPGPVVVPVIRRQASRNGDHSGDGNVEATYPGAPRKSGPVTVPVLRRQGSSQDLDISPLAAHPPVGKDHGDTDEGGQSAGSVANLPFPGHPR